MSPRLFGPLRTRTRHRVEQRRRGEGAATRNRGHPRLGPLCAGWEVGFRLTRMTGIGARSEAGVDVLLGLGDVDVGPFGVGTHGHRDVDSLVVLFDDDVVDPGVVVDLRSLQHAQHAADRVGVEHHRDRGDRLARI